MPEGVDDGDGPARAQHAHGVVEVLGGLGDVAVQDDHVVAARGHAGQHVQRPSGDQTGPVRGHARAPERPPRVRQQLGLAVDRREDAPGRHAVEQPQP